MKNILRLVIVFSGLMGIIAWPAVTQAATFNVNSDADAVDSSPGDGICATASATCTLRAAVQEANALPGADTIILPAGTYYLTGSSGEDAAASGDLDIWDDLTIVGAGQSQTFIDATNGATVDRIFQVNAGLNVSLSKMTLRAGGVLNNGGAVLNDGNSLNINEVTFDSNTSDRGGAIYSDGAKLALNNCIFTNNAATNGGALYIAAGTVTIDGTTLQSNQASVSGGGIYQLGTMSLVNVTLDGNSAAQSGGAIYSTTNASLTGDRIYIKNNTVTSNSGQGAGIYTDSNATLSLSVAGVANNTVALGATGLGGGMYLAGSTSYLENVTVSGNSADAAGGVYAKNGVVTTQNSTVASNSVDNFNLDSTATLNFRNTIIATPGSGSNCAGTGSFVSMGYNLSDDNVCGLNATGDQPNTNPLLGSLDPNNLTLALTGTSNPAQNAGDNVSCPIVDGAYNSRSDGACDIGAIEVGALPVQPGLLGFVVNSATVNEADGSITLNVSRTNGHDLAVSVDFATNDGTAIGGQDYIPNSGTLTWQNGDSTDKTITVQIVNDTIVEPDKTFTITLSNPGGSAGLSTITSSTITIVSNDTTAPPPDTSGGSGTDSGGTTGSGTGDNTTCAPGSDTNSSSGTDACTDGSHHHHGGRAAIDPLFLLFGFIGYFLLRKKPEVKA